MLGGPWPVDALRVSVHLEHVVLDGKHPGVGPLGERLPDDDLGARVELALALLDHADVGQARVVAQ